jgi:hypothetical protein
MNARFKIGDKIDFLRKDEVIRKGVVISGPWKLEGVNHYNVEWKWVTHEDSLFIGPDKIDLISDLRTTKYHYELSK